MNPLASLLAAFALLLPAAGSSDQPGALASASVDAAPAAPVTPVAGQVRVEERLIIRVTPRAALPMPMPRNVLTILPGQPLPPRLTERKIGKCVKAATIAGVQPNGPATILLFLRDRRVLTAELERTCRSRDFYSGFYLTRTEDGKMCIDRDQLQSRNGASCKLTRMRELVPDD